MLTLDDLYALETSDNQLVSWKIFRRGEALPDNIRTTCLEDGETVNNRYIGFAMGFWGDRQWLYSGVEQTAPATHAALMAASDLYMVLSQDIMSEGHWKTPQWYIESGGRLVQLAMQVAVPDCSAIRQGPMVHGHYLRAKPVLGHNLALAFCSHIGGMKIPDELPMGLAPGRLPGGALDWKVIYYAVLSEIYGVKSNFEEEFERAKPDVDQIFARLGYSGEQAEGTVRVFFDTGARDAQIRDYVLIQTPKDRERIIRGEDGEPVLYFVQQSDWQKIYVLNNPSVAIDNYVAHMLRNEAATFDFGPYLGEWK